MRAHSLAWLVVIVLGLSCGPLAKPKEDDLVGSYKMTAVTREYLKFKGYRDIPQTIYVHVERGGKLRLQNVPDCVFTTGEARGSFVSKTARWICCDNPTVWTRLEGLPLRVEIDGAIYLTLKLTGITPPYSLTFVIGDPDSNETDLIKNPGG